MSELVCIAFQDSSMADRVLNELRAMEREMVAVKDYFKQASGSKAPLLRIL